MTDPKRPSLLARVFGPRSAAQIVEQARRNRDADERHIVAAAVDAAVSRFAFTPDEKRQVMALTADMDVPLGEQADRLGAWIASRLPEWMKTE